MKPSSEQIDTWTALLGRCAAFARAAVALPETPQGERWRASIAPLIGLHAVIHALGEINCLAPSERSLGLDRASHLIRQESGKLNEAWRGEPLPDRVLELIEEAGRVHLSASTSGIHWLVDEERVVMPRLDEAVRRVLDLGFKGDVLGAPPGTILFRGEPALFARPPSKELAPLECSGMRQADHGAPPLQIYRQLDDATGMVTRDLVAPLDGALPPGRPLLVPMIEGGQPARACTNEAERAWIDAQRVALGDRSVPVTWASRD